MSKENVATGDDHPPTSDSHEEAVRLNVEVTSGIGAGVAAPNQQIGQFFDAANKERRHDVSIKVDIKDQDLTKRDFVRLYAVKKNFSNVDFTHSNFSNCYFHACKFQQCVFTGAIFKETNFSNSIFEACSFEYTHWDKTQVTPNILDNCLPSWENVAFLFARTLRINFTQVGNLEGINKAAATEVKQQGQMLFDAAFSGKKYYRERSKGWNRFLDALKYCNWRIWQFIWGNGESPFNVLLCAIVITIITSLWFFSCRYQTTSIGDSFLFAACTFWGVSNPGQWSLEARLVLTVLRYILFALFMASTIRRLSRR